MKNLVGKKFGRLVVLKRTDSDKRGNSRWLCKCCCGKEKIILGFDLKRRHTKSCGCLSVEKTIKRLIKHSHCKNGKKTKTYISWYNMIQRCINPKNKDYPNYGGRGIIVCKRWMKFENFLEDMGEHPGKGYSIDRIDNDGNYCKENCRWANIKQQSRNKRNSIFITYKNKTQLLIEWAEEFNINYSTLCSRIFMRGWSIEKALTTPVRKKGSNE